MSLNFAQNLAQKIITKNYSSWSNNM